MSADDGRVLADLPIGVGCDGAAFDGDIFASCLDGSLSVAREASPGKFEIIQNLKTRQGAATIGIDPSTHTLFLPTKELGHLMVIVVRRRPARAPPSGCFSNTHTYSANCENRPISDASASPGNSNVFPHALLRAGFPYFSAESSVKRQNGAE